VSALLDLLLPPVCPGCGREGAPICPACLGPLRRRLLEPAGVPVGLPFDLPAGLVQLEWCSAFSGPARAALHALKYDGERRLAPVLSALLAERWRQAGVRADLVSFVPVHEARRRERGFDQAELLARAAATSLGLQCLPLLRRRASTSAQHALGRGARAANVGGVFEVPATVGAVIEGRWILLVDDVVTTGATLAACAAALLDAGAEAVAGLTVARER
jgi:competence protein ComFC